MMRCKILWFGYRYGHIKRTLLFVVSIRLLTQCAIRNISIFNYCAKYKFHDSREQYEYLGNQYTCVRNREGNPTGSQQVLQFSGSNIELSLECCRKFVLVVVATAYSLNFCSPRHANRSSEQLVNFFCDFANEKSPGQV